MLTVAIGIATSAASLPAEAAWTLTLVNGTGETLTFYDVNASPPPARLPAGTVTAGGTFSIDPEGYNPVFAWDGGVSTTGTAPNGFLIGLALTDSPPLIQYKLFHYKATPGTAGTDPTLQPIILDDQVVEVTEGEVLIAVDTMWNATIGPPTVGACCTLDGCTGVTSSAACSDGTFLSGAACSPGLCTTASKTIGTGGGTIETPDGSVSVTFPPDCLTGSETITIEKGDYPSELYDIVLTGQPGADFNVHVAYIFSPTTLSFCPDAELCMTFDRTALGLDPADCNELRFFHKDKICGFDVTSNCVTDTDCPPGVSCHFGYTSHTVSCACPATSSIGTCCGKINHFSDYILVTPLEEPCPQLIRCCCGIGVLPILPLMLGILGLVKARRRPAPYTGRPAGADHTFSGGNDV